MLNLLFRSYLICLCCGVLIISKTSLAEAEIPKQIGFVNDYADLLSKDTEDKLEALLQRFRDVTTHEVIVATFPNHGDQSMDSFTSQVIDKWMIGYKDLGNGALFSIFKREGQAQINAGVGLTDQIPFQFRRSVIGTSAAPLLRKKQYDKGAIQVTHKLINKIDPSFNLVNPQPTSPTWIKTWGLNVLYLIICLSLLLDYQLYVRFLKRTVQSRSYVYLRQIGRYSFFEWWILYGMIPALFEYFFLHIFMRWMNPGVLISANHVKTTFAFHFKTGRGKFFGNGNSGRW